MAGFTITIAGDSALNLEFAHAISAETSAKIRMAADNLTADPIRGITELVPTFCSLMVYYNPLVVTFDELSTKLRSKLRDVGEADLSIRKIVPIPACYGGEFGPDLANVAQLAGLSEDEVIAIHTERDYLIDMLGFLPGFAYLGGLDERLHTPRLAVPRTRIYPLASPGGWQIIGRTPLKPYDPDREEPILYAAGEYLRFVPITPDEYTAIEAQLAAGTYSYGIFVEGE